MFGNQKPHAGDQTHRPEWRHRPVEHCPRCGENHGALLFRRIARPIHVGSQCLDYYATCPETGAPILTDAVGVEGGEPIG